MRSVITDSPPPTSTYDPGSDSYPDSCSPEHSSRALFAHPAGPVEHNVCSSVFCPSRGHLYDADVCRNLYPWCLFKVFQT